MHRVFVDERKWIDEARFQHMLAFCMLLPGPEAQQLATYIGWRLRGWAGALIAGWMFVIPGALIVLALSWLYVNFGEAAAGRCRVRRDQMRRRRARRRSADQSRQARAQDTPARLWIAVAAFVALLLGAPFPLVIIVAAIVGMLSLPRGEGGDGGPAAPIRQRRRGHCRQSSPQEGRARALWLILWLAPPALMALTLGTDHVLFQIALAVFDPGVRHVRRRLRTACLPQPPKPPRAAG